MLADIIHKLKVETYDFLHHPIGDRERILRELKIDGTKSLLNIKLNGSIQDFVPFITCGRIEFIYLSDRFLGFEGFDRFSDFYAIEHLVSVVSGIRSLVIGETHVVSQFKKAFHEAVKLGLATPKAFSIMSEVMRISKKIRSQLFIPSYSFAGFIKKKAIEIFGDISDKELFIVGTGEVAHDVYRISKFFKRTLVFSHERERAQQIARKISDMFGGKAECEMSLIRGISRADVVVIATRHHGFIIKPEDVSDISRRILMVDLSVPRNISPEVMRNSKIILYDIDSLEREFVRQEFFDNTMEMVRAEINKLRFRTEMETKVKDLAQIASDFQIIIAEHVKIYLPFLTEEEVEDLSKSLSKKLLARFFSERKNRGDG